MALVPRPRRPPVVDVDGTFTAVPALDAAEFERTGDHRLGSRVLEEKLARQGLTPAVLR